MHLVLAKLLVSWFPALSSSSLAPQRCYLCLPSTPKNIVSASALTLIQMFSDLATTHTHI